MAGTLLTLDEALELTRTGDVWLFRGRTSADRAIQVSTNSPVNHVGMSLTIEDLPPLLWHAELGRSLPDMWSGGHQRGAQLHDLRAAVDVWANRYRQRVWLRQLDPPVGREQEDAALRAVARLDGTPFPSAASLALRWLRGRLPGPYPRLRRQRLRLGRRRQQVEAEDPLGLETAFCAEVVALTYEAMGLLPAARHRLSWYDPGRFWSGDDLHLSAGFHLGGEIVVHVPPAPADRRRRAQTGLRRR